MRYRDHCVNVKDFLKVNVKDSQDFLFPKLFFLDFCFNEQFVHKPLNCGPVSHFTGLKREFEEKKQILVVNSLNLRTEKHTFYSWIILFLGKIVSGKRTTSRNQAVGLYNTKSFRVASLQPIEKPKSIIARNFMEIFPEIIHSFYTYSAVDSTRRYNSSIYVVPQYRKASE